MKHVNQGISVLLQDEQITCEGIAQIVRMAILIYGKDLINYNHIRQIFLHYPIMSSMTSEGASLLHWKMTFYVIETTYNYILKHTIYNTTVWHT
jgi:hypothetical protein